MENVLFTGVCTALVTPFRRDKVDYEKLEALLERQIAGGVSAVCIASTTGEAPTLRQEEYYGLLSHAIRICRGRIKVIAGTGSNATEKAVSMALEAEALGADGVLSVTPYYNKATPLGLISHFTAIADAVSCPVILYNVPSRTAVDIPLSVYKTLSQHPNIVGVKEASGDVGKAAQILNACGASFSLWSGNDDIIVPLMSVGAKGVISVLSNLCPGETVAMTNACLSGDFAAAAKMQQKYMRLIAALFSEVNPIPVKEAMGLMGLDAGAPRLPLCPMSAAAKEELTDAMKELVLLP